MAAHTAATTLSMAMTNSDPERGLPCNTPALNSENSPSPSPHANHKVAESHMLSKN